MAINRRTEKKVVKIIAIFFLIVGLMYCGAFAFYLAVFWLAETRNLPQIQAALDDACGAGIVKADRQNYDDEFNSYYSLEADCRPNAAKCL